MVLMITGLQVFLYLSDNFFPSPETVYDPQMLKEINARLDSMRLERNVQKKRIYPFNPNYITDFKGYVLGMSPEEIDRLMAFREKGLFLSSAKDFQRITGVSDSLLLKISPYFKFPSFQRKQVTRNPTLEKLDLNRAKVEDLRKVRGVGEILSKRIVSYRRSLGGYSLDDQLYEVYNLPAETAQRVLQQFEIRERPDIKKLNINTASFREILALPYIDYDLTRRIFEFKREEKLITDLSDLKQIDSFPLEKFDRIALYLLAE